MTDTKKSGLVKYLNGTKCWYLNGKLHRLDGQQLNIQMVRRNGMLMTNFIELMVQQLNLRMEQSVGILMENDIESMDQRLNMRMEESIGLSSEKNILTESCMK